MKIATRRRLLAWIAVAGMLGPGMMAQGPDGPRLGKYNIYSYGVVGKPPLYLGHLELMAGGKYRVSRTSSGNYFGEGTYQFDAGSHAVKWTSGPYATAEWGGGFSVDGKRHRIELRKRTIATNNGE